MKNKIVGITTLILILSLFTSLSALTLSACQAEDDAYDEGSDAGTVWETEGDGSKPLKVAVIADIHMLAATQIEDITSLSYDSYAYVRNLKRVTTVSEALFKTAVDGIIDSKPDVAILLGDLTENTSVEAMQIIADECARMERSGITALVVNGLTDTEKHAYAVKFTTKSEVKIETATIESYKHIFNDYGLGEAVMKDESSLSYLTDIEGTNYCALVVDTASQFEGETWSRDVEEYTAPKMSDAELEWIESALQYCEKSGKTPIAISYFPLTKDTTDYFGTASLGIYFPLDRGTEVLDLFAEYNVHTVLSAHIHAENTHVYNTSGKTITEYSTGCLTTYPSPIKYIKVYGTTSSARSTFTTAVKGEYLPGYVTAEERAKLTTDLASYSKYVYETHLALQTGKNVRKQGSVWKSGVLFFLDTFGLYFPNTTDPEKIETNKACQELSDTITTWMVDYNNVKIYGEGDTVESVCKTYGITLPRSKYEGLTVYEMILELIYSIQDGSYTYTRGDANMQLMLAIFKVGVYKLCDLDLFEIMHRINSDIRYCDMHVMGETVMTSDVLDVKADDLLLSAASVLIPYIKDMGLSFLVPIVQAENSQALINRFSGFMNFLVAVIPNFAYFTNENGEFETSFVSITKGEIYCTAFAEDLMIDVIARTGILE